jgi:hypothetical protein
VGLDRLRCHIKPPRDAAVGQAFGHQAQHLPFSRG